MTAVHVNTRNAVATRLITKGRSPRLAASGIPGPEDMSDGDAYFVFRAQYSKGQAKETQRQVEGRLML